MKMKLLVIWIFVIFFVLSSQSTFSMTQTPSSPINEADLTKKASSVPTHDESRQADVNDSLSCYDFQFTCEYGTPKKFKRLRMVPISTAKMKSWWTPLMSAMLNESGQEIVTLLVGAGANVNVTSWSGINALMLAAESSESSLVKYYWITEPRVY